MVDYGFFYSLAEAPFEFPEKHLTTPEVLRWIYNSEFSTRFEQIPETITSIPIQQTNLHTGVMPFSFGKDSLLTFALTKELSITMYPVFFVEPACPTQNGIKKKLYGNFIKEQNVSIQLFNNTLGNLRQPGGMMWGWDMLLTQYTLLLIPFLYAHKARYLFWSNEQSLNENNTNQEGYRINPTHDQSSQWVLHLNNLLRSYSLNTTVSSIIEPLHELLILYILHKRYPDIGKYQLSCDSETKRKKRWCGRCSECARVYIFMKAIGVDPKTIGLVDDMLKTKHEKLFYLFDKPKTPGELNTLTQSYGERLLAFYIAYKRGVTGDLMDKFVKTLLPVVEKQIKHLFNTYLTIHTPVTIEKTLYQKLVPIYRRERNRFLKEII